MPCVTKQIMLGKFTRYKACMYLRQPGLAPSNAAQLDNKLRFKCKQMSACKHSGNPFNTEFMSMPFVYVQACWKYSSKRCRSGFGIYFWIKLVMRMVSIKNSGQTFLPKLTWWNRMNSLTRSICVWYLVVPEYSRCIIADTLPKILAYISAGKVKF